MFESLCVFVATLAATGFEQRRREGWFDRRPEGVASDLGRTVACFSLLVLVVFAVDSVRRALPHEHAATGLLLEIALVAVMGPFWVPAALARLSPILRARRALADLDRGTAEGVAIVFQIVAATTAILLLIDAGHHRSRGLSFTFGEWHVVGFYAALALAVAPLLLGPRLRRGVVWIWLSVVYFGVKSSVNAVRVMHGRRAPRELAVLRIGVVLLTAALFLMPGVMRFSVPVSLSAAFCIAGLSLLCLGLCRVSVRTALRRQWTRSNPAYAAQSGIALTGALALFLVAVLTMGTQADGSLVPEERWSAEGFVVVYSAAGLTIFSCGSFLAGCLMNRRFVLAIATAMRMIAQGIVSGARWYTRPTPRGPHTLASQFVRFGLPLVPAALLLSRVRSSFRALFALTDGKRILEEVSRFAALGFVLLFVGFGVTGDATVCNRDRVCHTKSPGNEIGGGLAGTGLILLLGSAGQVFSSREARRQLRVQQDRIIRALDEGPATAAQ